MWSWKQARHVVREPPCFDVTSYIIFTHPVFLHLYRHKWHPWNISFPTIYNFMGVKCIHYKLCSVQSKMVYFSQFWGMKHFLGPVCDISTINIMNIITCTTKLINNWIYTPFLFEIIYWIIFTSVHNKPTLWFKFKHCISGQPSQTTNKQQNKPGLVTTLVSLWNTLRIGRLSFPWSCEYTGYYMR